MYKRIATPLYGSACLPSLIGGHALKKNFLSRYRGSGGFSVSRFPLETCLGHAALRWSATHFFSNAGPDSLIRFTYQTRLKP